MKFIRIGYKQIGLFVMLIIALLNSHKASAWGKKGHALVAEIAFQYLDDETKQNVLTYLAGIGIDSAANWMDAVRSNYGYDFMKPWHYINIEKGASYTPSADENIINRLNLTFNELKHKQLLCSDQVKFDLLVLFHLIGDLHQPLHAGYSEDKGGNTKQVEFLTEKGNLHHVWDESIVERQDINLDKCLSRYNELTTAQLKTIRTINFADWMNESRSFLDSAYDFKGFMLGEDYAKKNATLLEKRLLYAGIRLAAVLEKTFSNPTPTINSNELAEDFKNGINVNDAMKHIGKKVTICGLKSTEKVTFINLGARFPNSPLTVVIFAKDRVNFKDTIEELYNDKNVCVTGKIVEYKGKGGKL